MFITQALLTALDIVCALNNESSIANCKLLYILRDMPLVTRISSNSGFANPVNAQSQYIGLPYLYLGFLPQSVAQKGKLWVSNFTIWNNRD